jgi:hypothetical protein
MPAHPPDNDCHSWQSLSGVIVTNLPGADLNSSAGPKGGGQDARNKVRQGTPYRRLGNCSCIALLPHIHVRIATNGGEKCGLVLKGTIKRAIFLIYWAIYRVASIAIIPRLDSGRRVFCRGASSTAS